MFGVIFKIGLTEPWWPLWDNANMLTEIRALAKIFYIRWFSCSNSWLMLFMCAYLCWEDLDFHPLYHISEIWVMDTSKFPHKPRSSSQFTIISNLTDFWPNRRERQELWNFDQIRRCGVVAPSSDKWRESDKIRFERFGLSCAESGPCKM